MPKKGNGKGRPGKSQGGSNTAKPMQDGGWGYGSGDFNGWSSHSDSSGGKSVKAKNKKIVVKKKGKKKKKKA